MIFKEGALLLGIAAGLIIALMAAKLVANQMYGVSERDPFSFVSASLLLARSRCWPVGLQRGER